MPADLPGSEGRSGPFFASESNSSRQKTLLRISGRSSAKAVQGTKPAKDAAPEGGCLKWPGMESGERLGWNG